MRFFLFPLVFCTLLFADLSGIVVDVHNRALDSVKITFSLGPLLAYSNEGGEFTIDLAEEATEANLQLRLAGFRPEQSVQVFSIDGKLLKKTEISQLWSDFLEIYEGNFLLKIQGQSEVFYLKGSAQTLGREVRGERLAKAYPEGHLLKFEKTGYLDTTIEITDSETFIAKMELRDLGRSSWCKKEGNCGLFTDLRDGKKYQWTQVKNQIWMGQNLDFDTLDNEASACYDERPEKCEKYGRLYSFDLAMGGDSARVETGEPLRGVCPEGWHLPTGEEWNLLAASIAEIDGEGVLEETTWSSVGLQLKVGEGWMAHPRTQRDGNGLDGYGFSGFAAGNRTILGNYLGETTVAQWWMVNPYSAEDIMTRRLEFAGDDFTVWADLPGEWYPIRCVKNN